MCEGPGCAGERDLMGRWRVSFARLERSWVAGAVVMLVGALAAGMLALTPGSARAQGQEQDQDNDDAVLLDSGFELGSQVRNPRDLWSDGSTVWVANGNSSRLWAYDLATGQRASSRDKKQLWTTGNLNATGVWSNCRTFWVADGPDNRIYAYGFKTGKNISERSFRWLRTAGNTHARGIWSDGTTMWVADNGDAKLYAYHMESKRRVGRFDIDTLVDAGNWSPTGIWSDGVTMWVGDSEDAKVYAYRLDTGERDAAKDLNGLGTTEDFNLRGIWSDGVTMWVTDDGSDQVYAYPMPAGTIPSVSLSIVGIDVDFDPAKLDYTVTVGTEVSSVEVAATAGCAGPAITPADADEDEDGHQVQLDPGLNTITVTAPVAGVATTYTLNVIRGGSARTPDDEDPQPEDNQDPDDQPDQLNDDPSEDLVSDSPPDPGTDRPDYFVGDAATDVALGIVSDGFSLPPSARIHAADPPDLDRSDFNVGSIWRFGQVEVSGDPVPVVFSVEDQPDSSQYSQCLWGDCGELRIGVDHSGKLFLFVDEFRKSRLRPMNDFPEQPVELSAAAEGSPLKVYKEVLVGPSPQRPHCDDFPDPDANRYSCLMLREVLPAEAPATPDSMRRALPDLTQPDENYSLVFAEEFDGGLIGGDCFNGMVALSNGTDAWSYDTDPCNSGDVDASGVSCNNVTDGHYYMAVTSRCKARMDSAGRFEFKYGYLEVKYTIDRYTKRSDYINLAISLGLPILPLREVVGRYGIVPQDYEDILTTVGGVINVVEHLPNRGEEVGHTWLQPYRSFKANTDIEPLRTNWTVSCENEDMALRVSRIRYCSADRSAVTVTRGIEWTPRGYRIFIKVDGFHDDLVVWDPDLIEFTRRPASTASDGSVSFGSSTVVPRGETDNFFEYLDSSDDSVLLQAGISHVPMALEFSAWGYPHRNSKTIRSRMRIDYIRVFQPADRYLGMEPVFK